MQRVHSPVAWPLVCQPTCKTLCPGAHLTAAAPESTLQIHTQSPGRENVLQAWLLEGWPGISCSLVPWAPAPPTGMSQSLVFSVGSKGAVAKIPATTENSLGPSPEGVLSLKSRRGARATQYPDHFWRFLEHVLKPQCLQRGTELCHMRTGPVHPQPSCIKTTATHMHPLAHMHTHV